MGLRKVVIVVSNQTTSDVYYAKSYPDPDFDNDLKWERYKAPVYKVFLDGTDPAGKATREEWKALRFMPFWNDPKEPDTRYNTRGFANSGLTYFARKLVPAYIEDYKVHNTFSPFDGAIQIKGNFLVHAGPETTASDSWSWGAAGCVEVVGNFEDFRMHIIRMAGSTETDIHKGMHELVAAKVLYVQVDLARAPDLKAARDGDF